MWEGPSDRWPPLASSGRQLVRDPVTFPPGGKQPGHPSLFKPSWRRYGDGGRTSRESDDNSMSVVISVDPDEMTTMYLNSLKQFIDRSDTAEPWPASWEPEWVEWAEHIRHGGEQSHEAALALLAGLFERENTRERTPPVEQAVDTLSHDDFVGLEGIAALEHIVATLDGVPDELPHFIEACTKLADLYRRHGGRASEVTATFQRGLTARPAHQHRFGRQ